MTPPLILIGLGAGLSSALLYASATSGSPLALILFYVAPLPILLAGLGWRHHAGLIGAVVAALAIGLVFGPWAATFHFVMIGAPSWWLAYLALLARPGATESATEWYPIGRLVLWASVIGATLIALTIPLVGASLEEYRATLKALFEQALQSDRPGAPQLPAENRDAIINLMTALLPIMAAAMWTIVSLANLWLAGRITRASGRLTRPWPDLPGLTYPRQATLAFLGATAASLLPGLAGFAAELYAATFLVAFALLGLAVVHTTTRVAPTRGLILFGVYALLLIQPWVGVFLAALGVAEQTVGVRKRFGPPPGPPPTATAPKP
ncbi:DUF2232 domain-containing protein [Methylopila turkensis]|uniref:Membrane protein n=1 Tax=Methylopila turkensis TaxID=1437816 RepID=A0A9W6JLV8_9HYPH|nr:DUF2232 domain-containing protein [Methylopila turkensis]GLK80010.1 membrane protein [Methylopila turkensis]